MWSTDSPLALAVFAALVVGPVAVTIGVGIAAVAGLPGLAVAAGAGAGLALAALVRRVVTARDPPRRG